MVAVGEGRGGGGGCGVKKAESPIMRRPRFEVGTRSPIVETFDRREMRRAMKRKS